MQTELEKPTESLWDNLMTQSEFYERYENEREAFDNFEDEESVRYCRHNPSISEWLLQTDSYE